MNEFETRGFIEMGGRKIGKERKLKMSVSTTFNRHNLYELKLHILIRGGRLESRQWRLISSEEEGGENGGSGGCGG